MHVEVVADGLKRKRPALHGGLVEVAEQFRLGFGVSGAFPIIPGLIEDGGLQTTQGMSSGRGKELGRDHDGFFGLGDSQRRTETWHQPERSH